MRPAGFQARTCNARYPDRSVCRAAAADQWALLDAVGGRFDVLITIDANLQYQQNLVGRPVVIVVLRTGCNLLPQLLDLVPELRLVLEAIQPGDVREITQHEQVPSLPPCGTGSD